MTRHLVMWDIVVLFAYEDIIDEVDSVINILVKCIHEYN